MSLKKGTGFGAMVIHSGPIGDMDQSLSSWGYGLDLFPPPPRKKVKGEKALSSTSFVAPSASKRRTQSTILCKTDLLGVGDGLTDKDTLWLNQELLRC